MSQDGQRIVLKTSAGNLVKEASFELRTAIETALRPLGITFRH